MSSYGGTSQSPHPKSLVDTSAGLVRIKVLQVYSGNLFGGVERLLLTLHEYRRFAPRLVTEHALCFPGRLRDELAALGAVVHMLPEVRFSRPWTVRRARAVLRDVMRAGRFDVCITHSGWIDAAFAATVRCSGARLVRWVHGPVGGNWIDWLAARSVPDCVIANSAHTRSLLRDRVGAASEAEVIHCPVPSIALDDREGCRRNVRAALGTRPDQVVIVCTSRLEPWKGHRLLIDALQRLANRPGWECWIAGGAQRPEERVYLDGLRAATEQAGIADRTRFLGERRDIASVLLAADIHCQPNLSPEPFGIAFVEALTAGLPVVTTRLGAAPEIVEDGVCGLLTPPGDADALATAIGGLIADAARRTALGSRGPARATRLCDPAARMKQLERRLLSLVGAGNQEEC